MMQRIDRPATAIDVSEMLGEIDPLAMERLLATGASVIEIASAIHAIEDEVELGELSRDPVSPREAQARAVLEDLVFDSPDEEPDVEHIART
jgi:hypothetical protein